MKKVEWNPLVGVSAHEFVVRAIAAGAITLAFVMAQPFFKDMRGSTAQESQIEDGLKAAFGEVRVVRCLPAEEIPSRLNPLYIPYSEKFRGAAWAYLPFIWLDRRDCENISDFAANPPQTKADVVPGQVQSIFRLLHERGHTEGTINEGGASCEALQGVGALGVAFGAAEILSQGLANQAAKDFAEDLDTLQQNGRNELAQEYALNDCSVGSKYDLGTLATEQFPWPPKIP